MSVIKDHAMVHGVPRRRRARPVADAPIDALLVAAEDLAKGWLLALLEQAPLEAAPGILAADLARDGPRVCDAVVRALADDGDLRRIEPGGALEPLISRVAELSGAQAPDAVARAVDVLQGVIWSALRMELTAAEAEQISELAERLALISGHVRSAALRRITGSASAPLGNPGNPTGAPTPLRVAGRGGLSVASAPQPDQPAEALWIGAVRDEIASALASGGPLALLLAELDEADRVLAVEGGSEPSATFGRFAQAVRSAVRRKDILVCETDSRAWIIAGETGRVGGYALASRIARTVREAEGWRGGPLTVSVGVAVLGEDGSDAESLIEAAEEARFAAAAAGVSVIPSAEPLDVDPSREE
jgi:GGDEF domain-containing protein